MEYVNTCLVGAGAAWVLKRAKLAQQLLLDLPRESADLQTTLEALMQVTGGFSRLTALSLRAWQYSDEDLPSLIMAVSLLVGQSKELVFLSLDVMSLPLLPSLSHIRHLQLAVSYDNLPKVAHALGKLVTLQTLCLDGSKMAEDEAVGKQSNLDLQALAHLEGVMLDGLVLTSLRLPEGTALHAVAYSLAEAGDIFWTSVVGALKSFTLQTTEHIKTEEDIPDWMLQPLSLDTFVLAPKQFGRAYCEEEDMMGGGLIMLKGAFLRAERFCLNCERGIFVEVPKEHEWREVNMLTDSKLCVFLHDVAKFASCTEFFFRYHYFEGVELIRIASYLTEHALPFYSEQYGGLGEPRCDLRSRGAQILHDDVLECSTCRCGACRDCCRLDNFQGKRVPTNEFFYYNRGV